MDIELIFPLACEWAREQERIILNNGIPLSPDLLAYSERLDLKKPGKIRIMTVPSILPPTSSILQQACIETKFLFPNMGGLTLGHGIFVRTDCRGDIKLLVHELVHVSQYERLGGIDSFLRQYLSELLKFEYMASPLEQEARNKTSEIFRQ